MMNRATESLVIGCVAILALCTNRFAAAESAVKVVPKVPNLKVLETPDDREAIATIDQFDWPATVTDTDGQWMKIADEGGYSGKVLSGWVRSDDVVELPDVQSHATKEISEARAKEKQPGAKKTGDGQKAEKFCLARLYWLRGIYWENEQESDNAIADYQTAIRLQLKTGDVHLRLGRAWATRATRESKVNPGEAASDFANAIREFQCAQKLFSSKQGGAYAAQLHVSWGDALYEQYRMSKNDEDAKQGLKQYECAAARAGRWYVPPGRQGRLQLEIFKNARGTPRLLEAIKSFTQSIRLNPNDIDSYRDRADAQLELAMTAVGESRDTLLNQAFESAERAILLANNREPRTLEVKARLQLAMADALYFGSVPATPFNDQDATTRALITAKQSLLESAGAMAQNAANYSQGIGDIRRCLSMSADASSKAGKFADYVLGKEAAAIALAKSRLDDAQNAFHKHGETQLFALPPGPAVKGMTATFLNDLQHAEKTVNALGKKGTAADYSTADEALSKAVAAGASSTALHQSASQGAAPARIPAASIESVEEAREVLRKAASPPPPDPPRYTPLFRMAR
jgi:tetratricopeptide (TPR) repeat protein